MMALEAIDLTKTFVGGDGGLLTVLDGVSLQVEQGQMVAIVGASGAGTSTLLHLLGALDRPTRGRVIVNGEALDGLSDDALAALRNRQVGFVFQFHHLLREFSAQENVMIPLRIAGWDAQKAEKRARELRQQVVQPLRVRVIQVARRFIREENRWIDRERARDCGALLLSTGKL